MSAWEVVTKFDARACALADRHYSRRKIGSPQFMPPGQTLVLLGDAAVFGWWRPHPDSGLRAMNGLDGWTCTIFRNEGRTRSSELILDAERILLDRYDCGPSGLITYVWDRRIKSRNPGYCFKCAGWSATGRSADNRKTLLQKEVRHAGCAKDSTLSDGMVAVGPSLLDLAEMAVDATDVSLRPWRMGLPLG